MTKAMVERNGALHFGEIIFAPESWASFWPDAQQLLPKHYEEVGADPSKAAWLPAQALYESAEQSGVLFVMGARLGNGQLIGYQISTLVGHPHYKDLLCAFEDAFFLDPLYRRGRNGIQLIKASLYFLEKLGTKRVFFHSNQRRPTDKLFVHLGFERSHVIYSKWLGN